LGLAGFNHHYFDYPSHKTVFYFVVFSLSGWLDSGIFDCYYFGRRETLKKKVKVTPTKTDYAIMEMIAVQLLLCGKQT
jgi:hypothetical protein